MTNKTEAQPEALRLAGALEESIPGYPLPTLLESEAAAELRRQHAEIARLTTVLKKANDQTEHFEREWYLRGDCIERLTAELVKEAALTAAEKLRADQMTQRLDMANRLNTDARNQLAQLSARQAAPDGRLRTALERIIGWNRDHANELCGDPDRAEGWACVREARAALTAAPPPPEREPLSDDQWQALADALDGIINRELKDKISTILQLPTE